MKKTPSIVLISLFLLQSLFSATDNWIGTTNDLLEVTNWSSGAPSENDCTFNDLMVSSYTPSLGLTGNSLEVLSFSFNSSNLYHITIGDTHSSNLIIRNGFTNTGSTFPHLTIQNNSSLTFQADSPYTIASGSTFTIDSGSALFFTNNNTLTCDGLIEGAGRIEKSGSSSLTLTQANTFTGSTTISNNELYLKDAGSIAHSANVSLGDNSSVLDIQQITSSTSINNFDGLGHLNLGSKGLTINNDDDLYYYGIITGDGELTVTGDGSLILLGHNSFSGNCSINEGTLTVEQLGIFLSGVLPSNVTVNNGSILKGSGTVGDTGKTLTVNSGGTVSPGNSDIFSTEIATLHVGGDYIQNPGSTLEVQINKSGQSDLVIVAGNAQLNGGNVHVIPVDGYTVGAPYLIFSANTLNGRFDSVDSNSLFSLSYVGNLVYLNYQSSIIQQIVNLTHNQKQVAYQFDNLTSLPANVAQIVQTLSALSESEQQNALNQMSGEQYTSLLYLAQSSSDRFLRKIYYPLIKRTPCLSTCGETLNIWTSMEGGKATQYGNANCNGYKSKDWNIAIGAHKCINDWTTLGLALSYEHDHINFNLNGKDEAKTGLITLYGSYQDKILYYISELLGGYSKNYVNRDIIFGSYNFTNESTIQIAECVFNNELGLNFNYRCFGFKPFIDIEYGYYHKSKENEFGNNPLTLELASKHKNTFRGFLGAHFACVFQDELTLGLDISWENRFNYSKDSSITKFNSFGNHFIITSYKKHDDIGHLSFDIDEQFNEYCSVSLVFSGEKGKNYHSWDVLGGLSFKW